MLALRDREARIGFIGRQKHRDVSTGTTRTCRAEILWFTVKGNPHNERPLGAHGFAIGGRERRALVAPPYFGGFLIYAASWNPRLDFWMSSNRDTSRTRWILRSLRRTDDRHICRATKARHAAIQPETTRKIAAMVQLLRGGGQGSATVSAICGPETRLQESKYAPARAASSKKSTTAGRPVRRTTCLKKDGGIEEAK